MIETEYFRNQNLKIFYENIDGISDHKCVDLLLSSSSADYDIISLTETWLVPTTANTEFFDQKYNVFRKDRSSTAIAKVASTGGGVLIAVKSNIVCEKHCIDKMNELEAICVRIPLASGFNASRSDVMQAYFG